MESYKIFSIKQEKSEKKIVLKKNKTQSFPGGSDGKESACNVGDQGSVLGQEDLLKKEWLPTPVFLPGEFQGQRNLAGYSPLGHKESDMTVQNKE